jgi:hypothetical protein
MITTLNGTLEIDHKRGVIYFHSNDEGITRLRICRLPKPIPKDFELIDLTHMVGVYYSKNEPY